MFAASISAKLTILSVILHFNSIYSLYCKILTVLHKSVRNCDAVEISCLQGSGKSRFSEAGHAALKEHGVCIKVIYATEKHSTERAVFRGECPYETECLDEHRHIITSRYGAMKLLKRSFPGNSVGILSIRFSGCNSLYGRWPLPAGDEGMLIPSPGIVADEPGHLNLSGSTVKILFPRQTHARSLPLV